jgi:hypothetical protein
MKTIVELTAVVDQMADITKNFVGVAQQMKNTIDGMKGAEKDDLPPVTQ